MSSVSAISRLSSVSGSSLRPDFRDNESASSNAAARPAPADVKKAARQFEAILVRQLLAPAIEPMMSGGSLGAASESGASSGSGVYGYMLTDVLSESVTQGGGLGLADVITRQLSSPADLAAAAKADAKL